MIATELKAKGAVFEHYPDAEGLRLEGDVHVAGDMKLVRMATFCTSAICESGLQGGKAIDNKFIEEMQQ